MHHEGALIAEWETLAHHQIVTGDANHHWITTQITVYIYKLYTALHTAL